MSDFEIRPYAYTEQDAAKLAVMWNESDEQWPGTFTGGVPFTPERVREWMDRESGLMTRVVDDPTQERIVGYGSLWEEHGKEKTCYVALLNVHPAYQGKSLARRMLVQMIDRAVELGYHLMTIGTWSGNLKSVPLYKKVGFFWVPDTSVFMENLVPLIRQMGVAQPYFQRHDWYTTFQRELLQVEDDQRHGAMKIYRYHWAENGDSLPVLIDREAKAPTGVETEHLAVYAELDEIEPAHGLPYPIRWRVSNKQGEPVNVSILASGDPGIDIDQQHAFVLAGGQERVIEGLFTVSPEIEPVKKDRPAPRIKMVLVVGGQVVELGCGVRPRSAVKISTEPAYPVLLPGRPQTIHVQLHNHLDRPLRGVVSLAPQVDLTADWEGLRHDFALEAQGYAGLPLTVTCDQAGAVPLRFKVSFAANGKTIDSRTERVPLYSLPPGGVSADIGPSGAEGNVIVVQNEFFRLRCRPEGGRCAVWNQVNERVACVVREVLGPPFVPSELWFKSYDLALEQDGGWVKAILRARSNNFPGLVLIKEVTASASPLITLRYRLANEGSQAHTCQLNPRIWFGDREKARITLPRAERLVRERAEIFSAAHGDVPEEPEGMAERWLAWRADDFVVGLVWDETVEKHTWQWTWVRLDRPSLTLEPGEAVETPPLYLYAGPGDWVEVRRAWIRLSGEPDQPPNLQPEPERKLEFGFDPAPIISLGDQVEATLRVDNLRELPLDGQIALEPPDGWRVEPAKVAFEQVKREQPWAATVRFQADQDGVGASTGQLCLESERFDVSQPLTLIRLGDPATPVQVQEKKKADQTIFVVDNGHSRWHVAPNYQAGVVGWYQGNSDVNHLYSAFPEPDGKAMGWLKPWFGGIQPLLNPTSAEGDGWPGKLYQERFVAQPCERMGPRGLTWHGVCLSVDIDRQELQGLRAEVEYLTIGRSNLLKMVYRLINQTGIYWRVSPDVFGFCQVDGRWDNSTLYGDGVQLKRDPVMNWPVVGRWGAVTNPDSERTLVMVSGTAQASLCLSDWGQDGGHLLCQASVVILPNSQEEITLYLALTDSPDMARRYAALAV